MSEYNRNQLLALLNTAAERSKQGDLSLGELAESLKDASFCFLGILVCLPFLFPISVLGPLTIPGGLAIAALGWQMFRGAEQLVLPKRFAAVKLGASAWSGLLGACRKLLGASSRIAKPRLQHWTSGKRGEYWAGVLIFVSGVLLAIPMGGVVPFNNTLPALCAVCACIALLENDGVFFLIAVGFLIATLIYFALIGLVLIYAGAEFKLWLSAHWPSWL